VRAGQQVRPEQGMPGTLWQHLLSRRRVLRQRQPRFWNDVRINLQRDDLPGVRA
jgi:hypothetical protein